MARAPQGKQLASFILRDVFLILEKMYLKKKLLWNKTTSFLLFFLIIELGNRTHVEENFLFR